jgi:hypothetical protein
MTRLFGLTGVLALLACIGVANADNHHNGHSLIKGKLNQNGKHVIHSAGNHTAHAHVKGGKISHVEVAHRTKGMRQVTKYKTTKRFHALAEQGAEHYFVMTDDAAASGDTLETQFVVTAFVGFGFIDDNGQLIIFWFPVAIVLGGDTGAVVYDPV